MLAHLLVCMWYVQEEESEATREAIVQDRQYQVCAVGMADVRLGWQMYGFSATVTAACAKRTGAAASVERRRRESEQSSSCALSICSHA